MIFEKVNTNEMNIYINITNESSAVENNKISIIKNNFQKIPPINISSN